MTQGNNAADGAAREASGCSIAIMAPAVTIEPQLSVSDIANMQNQAPANEKQLWKQRGASTDGNGIWRSHEGLLVAPLTLVSFLSFK